MHQLPCSCLSVPTALPLRRLLWPWYAAGSSPRRSHIACDFGDGAAGAPAQVAARGHHAASLPPFVSFAPGHWHAFGCKFLFLRHCDCRSSHAQACLHVFLASGERGGAVVPAVPCCAYRRAAPCFSLTPQLPWLGTVGCLGWPCMTLAAMRPVAHKTSKGEAMRCSPWLGTRVGQLLAASPAIPNATAAAAQPQGRGSTKRPLRRETGLEPLRLCCVFRFAPGGYTEHLDEAGRVKKAPPFEAVAKEWTTVGRCQAGISCSFAAYEAGNGCRC
jgi:hypothetical protein